MQDNEDVLDKVLEILHRNPKGMAINEISKEININRNAVAKYLDILQVSGKVEMKPVGRAKIFCKSQRIPLNAMLNYTQALILVLNNNLDIVQVNDRLLNVMTKQRENIIGKNIFSLKYPIFTDSTLKEKLEKCLFGQEVTFEKYCSFNSNKLYCSIRLIPSVFEDGALGVSIIIDDITDRKRVEEELLLKTHAMESSINAICILDLDFSIKYVNPSFEGILGYKKEEIEGNQPFEISKVKKNYELIEQTFQAKETLTTEISTKKKDGTPIDVLISLGPIYDQSGKLISYLMTFIEITERKRIEKSLIESEVKFRTIAEMIDIPIQIIQDSKYKFINESLAKELGFSREEMMNWTPNDMAKRIHSEDLPLVLQQTAKKQEGMKDGAISTFKIRWIDREGKIKWVEARSKTIYLDNKPALLGAYIVQNDKNE